MNIGELIREKERLEGVVKEAAVAKAKIKQLNVLIAMYGDDPKVTLEGLSKIPTSFPRPTTTLSRPEKMAKNLAKGKRCHIPGCEAGEYIRGVCGTHYDKFVKGSLDAELCAYVLEARPGWGKNREAS